MSIPTHSNRSTILPHYSTARVKTTARCRFTRSAWRRASAFSATSIPILESFKRVAIHARAVPKLRHHSLQYMFVSNYSPVRLPMALYSQCKINALASLCLRVNRATIACAANAAPSLPNEFKRRAVTTRAPRASQPMRTACSLAAACYASACHALDVNIRRTTQTKSPGRESEGWRQTGACRTQHPAGCRRAHGQCVERELRWTTGRQKSWQGQPRRQLGQNQL